MKKKKSKNKQLMFIQMLFIRNTTVYEKKIKGTACLYKHLQQNLLYRAARIAKFDGILGFSLLSII